MEVLSIIRLSMLRVSLFLLVYISALSPAFGWGTRGHYIVAEIAERHLSTNAKKEVRRLLDNKTLPQIANWADEIKSVPSRKKANRWHYVNVSKGKEYRKSSSKNKIVDVITAISSFKEQLKSKDSSDKQKNEALKFLVHFVADIHQPLHNGFAGDRGGNDVRHRWFGKDSNLHRIWDDELVEMQKLSFTEYADFINAVSAEQVKNWQQSRVLQWHKEARAVIKFAYQTETGKDWEYRYSFKVRKMHDGALLKAGVRLAGMLNSIF